MTRYVVFLVMLLALGVSGLFVLKRPDGQPWLDYRSFIPDFRAMKSQVENSVTELSHDAAKLAGDDKAGEVKVYKWKGEDGSWKFSDAPPPSHNADAAQAEEVWINPDQNLVQGLVITEKEEAKPEPQQAPTLPVPMTLSPDKVKKLMDDANNIQQLVDDRQKALEQQLSN